MTIQRIVTPILAIILFLTCASTSFATEVVGLTPSKAQATIAEMPDMVILDIRTPDEYREAHIKDARNIDFYGKDFQSRLDQLDKTTPYFIYCRSGRRSSITIEYMQQTGFATIFHLGKGINSWKGAGLPLVR